MTDSKDRKEKHSEDLINLYEQIHRMDNDTLLTCATFYVKDMIEYMSLRGLRSEVFNTFFASYQNILEEHRFFWERFATDLFITLEEAGFPHNMTNLAAGENFEVPFEPCKKKNETEEEEDKQEKKCWYLIKESKETSENDRQYIPDEKICAIWIKFLGWNFFKELTKQHQAKILDYYRKEDLENMTCRSKVLNISEDLRRYCFSNAFCWYPLSVIFSLLLIRTKFVTVLQA